MHRVISIITAILLVAAISIPTFAAKPIIEDGKITIVPPPVKVQNAYTLSDYELNLVYKIVHLEMQGQSVEGKTAVASAIFNRLDSGLWGKTMTDVIFAKGQFETIFYLFDGLVVEDNIIPIVDGIVKNGVPSQYSKVMHFRTDHYHYFGTPLFNIGNVYFSGV